MRSTIDKAGRVVIPASIRDRAGLTPGTELEVTADDTGVRIERVARDRSSSTSARGAPAHSL
jgi:AbrB family looped-hinge helix DNA binding protein